MYNIPYTIAFDNVNELSYQLSEDTLQSFNKLKSLIPSYYTYMYKTTIPFFFTNTVNYYDDLRFDRFEVLLKDLECYFLLESLNKYRLLNHDQVLLISFLSYIKNLPADESNNLYAPDSELSKLIYKYLDDYRDFTIEYEKFVKLLIKDSILQLSKELSKLSDNIKVCLITSNTQDSLYQRQMYRYQEETKFFNHFNYGLISSYTFFDKKDMCNNLIKKLSDLYLNIEHNPFDKLLSNIQQFIKCLVKYKDTYITQQLDYESLRNLFFYLYSGTRPNIQNNSIEYNHSQVNMIPYIPLLLGIEYDNKLYKVQLDLNNKNQILRFDNKCENLVYFNQKDLQLKEITLHDPMQSNILGYSNTYDIIKNNIVGKNQLYSDIKPYIYELTKNYIVNNIDLSNIDSSLLYKNILNDCDNKHFSMYDWASFNDDIYKRVMNVVWNCVLLEYKNGIIKKELENVLAREAFNTLNPHVKNYIMKDIEKGLSFKIQGFIDDGTSMKTLLFSPTINYISNIHFLCYNNYIIGELISHNFYNFENNNTCMLINLALVTLVQDSNGEFYNLQELIAFDPDNKTRNCAYDIYFKTSNSNIIDNLFFCYENTNDIRIKLRSLMLESIYKYISKEYVLRLINKVFYETLDNIGTELRSIFSNNKIPTTFNDLSTEISFYTSEKNNIICKYFE